MRAGDFENAKIELERALKTSGSAKTSTSYIEYFLAITEHQLGSLDSAQTHLEIANTLADEELSDNRPGTEN